MRDVLRVIFRRLIFDYCSKRKTKCKPLFKSVDGESAIKQSQAAVVGAKPRPIRSMSNGAAIDCTDVFIRFIRNNRMDHPEQPDGWGGYDSPSPECHVEMCLNVSARFGSNGSRTFIPWGMYQAHRIKRFGTHYRQTA